MRVGWIGVAIAIPGVAQAFGGAVLGHDGPASVVSAHLVVALNADSTVLTLMPRVSAATQELAVVVPVAGHVLNASEALTTDFRTLDTVTAPHLLEYTCVDLYPFLNPNQNYYGYYGYYGYYYNAYYADESYKGPFHKHAGRGDFACDNGIGRVRAPREYPTRPPREDTAVETGGGGDTIAVAVTQHFVAGDYTVEVLDAEDSAALAAWFGERGFAIDDATELQLGAYVAAGDEIVVATLTLDEAPEKNSLPPLQLKLEGLVGKIPLRLGTMNSPGRQDLTVQVIDSHAASRTTAEGIARVTVDDECMWQGDGETLQEFHAAYVDAALDAAITALPDGDTDTDGGAEPSGVHAAYDLEYFNRTCADCVSPTFAPALLGLGYDGDAQKAAITRFRLRYDLNIADDLVLAAPLPSVDIRTDYFLYDASLESDFPVCGLGMVDNPGSCLEETSQRPASIPLKHGGTMGLLLLTGGWWWRASRKRHT